MKEENYILLREMQVLLVPTSITRIQMSYSASATLQIHSLPHSITIGQLQRQDASNNRHNGGKFLHSEFLIVLQTSDT
jgi:hypothetical protein